jgi:hypothetical protein
MARGKPPRIARATFDLSSTAKYKLATMKNDLRLAGLKATEKGIVEMLILNADIKLIRRLLPATENAEKEHR